MSRFLKCRVFWNVAFSEMSSWNVVVFSEMLCFDPQAHCKLWIKTVYFIAFQAMKQNKEQDYDRNCMHIWTKMKVNILWPSWTTPSPLHVLPSGQSLSSTTGSGHWLSSSVVIERPESRSKQARKRLWIETIVVLLMTSSSEKLSCTEEKGMQEEQGVHSDHSLRMAERRKNETG